MKRYFLLLGIGFVVLGSPQSHADYSSEAYYQEGLRFAKRGEHFQAARYFFQSEQRAENDTQKAMAYAQITNNLAAEKLYQSASYFYLKAISGGVDAAVREALKSTQVLSENVGNVIFKKYVLKYTRAEQYPIDQKNYFYYQLAQDHLLSQKVEEAISTANGITASFPRYPSALFLRGTGYLLVGHENEGIEDFKKCADLLRTNAYAKFYTKEEAREQRNRCLAGAARGYYQAKKYTDAETWYDQIEIESIVWPQVLYERAWNAIARGDYNRALGRLVTYKAPSLTWFHDSEIEMLRAMSYLQMCMYDEVEKESNYFVKRHGEVGEQIKKLLEHTADGSTKSLVELFQKGAEALRNKAQSPDPMNQVLNRFVRSPYFVSLVQTGGKVSKEMHYIDSLGVVGKRGLGGFLKDTLLWRWQTDQEIGGGFVRDRLSSEYQALLTNVKTMDIVKLEMLRRAKGRAELVLRNDGKDVWGNKKRGSLGTPKVREDQYFWDFNGEFWADELGDYVFALRPECS